MLPAISALLFFSFSKNKDLAESKTYDFEVAKTSEELNYNFTVDTTEVNFPMLQNDYHGFKAAVGFKESQSNYAKINDFGYLGKYQFGKNTLALIGVFDMTLFVRTPEVQEEAFYAYTARNKWVLRREIKKYSGKTINGVEVTESGILAAAHLAGPGGVKRYLHNNGGYGVSDAFGTTIKHYMEQFAGYDMSSVEVNRQAKVDWVAEDKQTV